MAAENDGRANGQIFFSKKTPVFRKKRRVFGWNQEKTVQARFEAKKHAVTSVFGWLRGGGGPGGVVAPRSQPIAS